MNIFNGKMCFAETAATGQALQDAGQSHIVHALVETNAKGQALQAAGQSHIIYAMMPMRPVPLIMSFIMHVTLCVGDHRYIPLVSTVWRRPEWLIVLHKEGLQ